MVELPLTPGALSDDTDLAAKLHAIGMDKTRSRGGRWETIKGWTEFSALPMTAGTARAIHTYSDLDGNPIVIAASESAVNAWMSGSRIDITPLWTDVWLGTGALTAGSSSTELIVNWVIYNQATNETGEASRHFLQVGDVVTFSNLVNEDATPEALNGPHTITSVAFDHFTIAVTNTANIDVQLPFICTMAFRAGLATGVGDMVSQKTRIASIDNFGENAVFYVLGRVACLLLGTIHLAARGHHQRDICQQHGMDAGNRMGDQRRCRHPYRHHAFQSDAIGRGHSRGRQALRDVVHADGISECRYRIQGADRQHRYFPAGPARRGRQCAGAANLYVPVRVPAQSGTVDARGGCFEHIE